MIVKLLVIFGNLRFMLKHKDTCCHSPLTPAAGGPQAAPVLAGLRLRHGRQQRAACARAAGVAAAPGQGQGGGAEAGSIIIIIFSNIIITIFSIFI